MNFIVKKLLTKFLHFFYGNEIAPLIKKSYMDDNNQPLENNEKVEINSNSAVNNAHSTDKMEELENTFQEIIKEKDDKITKLSVEITEHKDKYIRLFAEFDNFRRRTAKEKLELINTAGKDVVLSFLEILDDLERAEKIMQDQTLDLETQKEGIKLIFNKFKILMQNKGVISMDSIGYDFDTEKHEAVNYLEVSDENQKGKVIDELSKGYLMNAKIIRFAKVIVGK